MIFEADKATNARMEAAEALLGVSPNTTATTLPVPGPAKIPFTSSWEISVEAQAAPGHFKFQLPFEAPANATKTSRRDRDIPVSGLDALAMLASSAVAMDMDHNCSNRSPPRQQRQRPRSVSNPEGMEKWDSLRHAASALGGMGGCSGGSTTSSSNHLLRNTCRQAHHFVQPTIFEDSVLDHTTSSARELRSRTPSPSSLRNKNGSPRKPLKKRTTKVSFASKNENQEHVVPRYIKSMEHQEQQQKESHQESDSKVNVVRPVAVHSSVIAAEKYLQEIVSLAAEESQAAQVDVEAVKSMAESELKELLVQARGKLLDDVVTSAEARASPYSGSSNSSGTGAASSMVLPHDLTKYRDVYNKNGRIGVYTPSERAAIIARFQAKRSRRVWNKKIRYSCRKNLADKRLRVKGRFVKRGTTRPSGASPPRSLAPHEDLASETPSIAVFSSTVALCSRSPSPPPGEEGEVLGDDSHMPDVENENAGFCPTDDMPYRRTRRHTIT
jgi:hypothetical protein